MILLLDLFKLLQCFFVPSLHAPRKYWIIFIVVKQSRLFNAHLNLVSSTKWDNKGQWQIHGICKLIIDNNQYITKSIKWTYTLGSNCQSSLRRRVQLFAPRSPAHPPLLRFQRFQVWDQSLRENGSIRTFAAIKSCHWGSRCQFKPQQLDSLVSDMLRCEGLIGVLHPSPPRKGLTPKTESFVTVQRESPTELEGHYEEEQVREKQLLENTKITEILFS